MIQTRARNMVYNFILILYIYVYDVERPSFIGNWKIINTMKKTNQKNKITTPIKTNQKQKQKTIKNNKQNKKQTKNNKQRTV